MSKLRKHPEERREGGNMQGSEGRGYATTDNGSSTQLGFIGPRSQGCVLFPNLRFCDACPAMSSFSGFLFLCNPEL